MKTTPSDVHLMLCPLHNRLAAPQSVHDAVVVAVTGSDGVCVAVFDDPSFVWNENAVIVGTHYMDEGEYCKITKIISHGNMYCIYI